MASHWEVVGGGDKGGVIVRAGEKLASEQLPQRLSTGAVVKQKQLVGDRLHYELVTGDGPQSGWVSVRLSNKELLVRTLAPAPKATPTPQQQPAAFAPPSRETPASRKEAPGTAQAGGGIFNRQRLNGHAPKAANGHGEFGPSSTVARVFEVVRAACTIHAEPHMDAKVIAVKSQGQRVTCTEVTMNGWLKLSSEPGWMLSYMHGASEGLGEVARIVGEPGVFACTEYQPQALACFEVNAAHGVQAREAPHGQAQAIAYLRPGELVFAQTQSFDGWVRLGSYTSVQGPLGWMTANGSDGKPLLKTRPAKESESIDLWALADAWTAARRARGMKLGPGDIDALKRVERLVLEMTNNRFHEYMISGNKKTMISDGLLTEAQLEQPNTWVKQSLFASMLAKTVSGGIYAELVPNFVSSPRVPPLPQAEEDHLGVMGFWSAACLPFEHDGKCFMMAPNGICIDPGTQGPIGSWSPETQQLVPFALVQLYDSTYMMTPDGMLYDPKTQEAVGALDPETHEIKGLDAMHDPDHIRIDMMNEPAPPSGGAGGKKKKEADLATVQKHLDWARQNAKRRCWNMAINAFGKALEACEQARAMDIDVECEILRGRAACWLKMEKGAELLADAKRILELDGEDAEALEWRSIAIERFGQADSKGVIDAALAGVIECVDDELATSAEKAEEPSTSMVITDMDELDGEELEALSKKKPVQADTGGQKPGPKAAEASVAPGDQAGRPAAAPEPGDGPVWGINKAADCTDVDALD